MFQSLPIYLKESGVASDVRTLLLLRKSLEKGLVKTLGDLYMVLKGLVVKSPEDVGPFAQGFYAYFLGVNMRPGEKLSTAIERSDAFKEWKQERKDRYDWEEEMPELDRLIDEYLDEVHLTSHDIKRALEGDQILENDNPDKTDDQKQTDLGSHNMTDTMVDYSQYSLEELMERMKRVAEQQKHRHQGGSHWVGQYGNSPYGNSGMAKDGIRVGGSGGGEMARKVIGNPNFYPVDKNAILKDDNIDAALASLKGIEEETAEVKLDIQKTIKQGLKEGGLFLPYEKEEVQQKLRVLLLIDNGGWSMSPYVQTVRKLFSKMNTRFAHDLKVHYFHNTIEGCVYEDAARFKPMPLSRVLDYEKDYCIFIIGDAAMSPWELDEASVRDWQALEAKFKKVAWLNPVKQRYWHQTYTTQILAQVFKMYPLTPKGIEDAVLEMNGVRK